VSFLNVWEPCFLTFFYFWGLRGWPWQSGFPPPYASAHHYHLLGMLVISRRLSTISLLFARIMTLNHNLYKIMNVKGYGIIMIKISVELSWNFSWKVFITGQIFTRLITFSITGQRLIFLVPCFYNRVLPRWKFFVCFLPAFANFKPTLLELEKSCQLPLCTLLTRTRPADHPNPCPSHTFSVPIPRLSEKTTKNSSPLNTCLTSSKIKLIVSFHWQPNQHFPHMWSTADLRW